MATVVKNLHQSLSKTFGGVQISSQQTYSISLEELKAFQGDDRLINALTMDPPEASVNDLYGSNGVNELMGLNQHDSEGALMSRIKATKTGWSYHVQGVEFATANSNSVINNDINGNDLGFVTYTMYDDQDEITLIDANCTKTVLDWEPSFNYEIIGGKLKILQETTDSIYVYVLGVPDVPASMGGSKEFISCVNMKFIKDHDEIKADGRASKYLPYDPVYHTNKMRLILRHNAGVTKEFLMMFEVFKL